MAGFQVSFNHSPEGSDDEVDLQGGREFSRWRRNLFPQNKRTVLGIDFIRRYGWSIDGLQGKLRPYGITGVGLSL
jgi:hypothetical protein